MKKNCVITELNCQAFAAAAKNRGIKTAHISQWQNNSGIYWTNISGFHTYRGRRCEESKSWHGPEPANLLEVAKLLEGYGLQVTYA